MRERSWVKYPDAKPFVVLSFLRAHYTNGFFVCPTYPVRFLKLALAQICKTSNPRDGRFFRSLLESRQNPNVQGPNLLNRLVGGEPLRGAGRKALLDREAHGRLAHSQSLEQLGRCGGCAHRLHDRLGVGMSDVVGRASE